MGWEPPRIDAAALIAHRDLRMDLSQWAPTIHRLVCERIDALVEANGDYEHPTETALEYAQRVLAQSQHPFPPGVSIYDELASNRGYDWLAVGYGLADEEGCRIQFSGTWSEIVDDEIVMHRVEIHCPGWVVSAPDGITRFETQTASMCDQVRADNAAFKARISEAVDAWFAERRRS